MAVGLLAAALTGCGTPAEVKQLSTAQIGYLDAALAAVRLQSEALVAAAEQIKAAAEARIADLEAQTAADMQQLATTFIPGQPASERAATARQMLDEIAKTAREAEKQRGRLAADVAAIRSKTAELEAYIAKMRDVQVALDAYLQSEQAGEQVVQSVLNQPSVQSLLGTVNGLLPKVSGAAEDLKLLLSGLQT